ncbi:hypothetical protein ACIQZG_12380 [Lysinibacillus sp. NPDC096418]|uniref:hypothetical protein n=1 Tax=Lysinibacillus sp. NPDC096418 TaxID=3364138 RepID=UPI00382BDAE5
MNPNLIKYIILIVIVYIAGWNLGVFEFIFIPQVLSLIGSNPIDLIMAGHQWGPRYLIAFPAVYMHEQLGFSLDYSYSIYCTVILASIVVIFVKAGIILKKKYINAPNVFFLVSIFSTLILAYLMNGRLIPAYLGITIILYKQFKVYNSNENFSISDYITMFVGFMLSTTSSGTMMVSLLQISLVSFILTLNKGKHFVPVIKFIIVNSVIYIGLLGPYIIKMINKNLTFYGGGSTGLINMLSHGLGKILLVSPILVWLIILSIPFIFIFCVFIQLGLNIELRIVILTVFICLLCGMFGISTATMIIPVLIFLVAMKSSKIASKIKII